MSGTIDSSIRDYFDENAWNSLSNYEKLALSNKKRNYVILRNLGFDSPVPDFMRTIKRPLLIDPEIEKSDSPSKDQDSQKGTTAPKRTEIQKQKRSRSEKETASSNSSKYMQSKSSLTETGPKYHLSSKRSLSKLIPRTERHLQKLMQFQNLLEKHGLENDVVLESETEESESYESVVVDDDSFIL